MSSPGAEVERVKKILLTGTEQTAEETDSTQLELLKAAKQQIRIRMAAVDRAIRELEED